MMKERKPNRMQGYDYSTDNLYFITTCVHNRVCCFGEIVNNRVGTGRDPSLHDPLQYVVGSGRDPSQHDPLQYVVGSGRDLTLQRESTGKQMVLNEFGKIAEKQWFWLQNQYPYVVLHAFVVMPNHVHGIIEINRSHIVGTGRDLSLQCDLSQQYDTPPDKIKSLSELMGAYKTTVSKQIHLLGYSDFAWQRSFYDRIIRDEQSYEKISNYIINNPSQWEEDKFFK